MNQNELEEYVKKLHRELTFLNSNVFVLKKIVTFPWAVLRILESNKTFLQFCFKNSIEYSIIVIRRIYFDTNSEAITIPKLKAQLFRTHKQQIEISRQKIKTLKEQIDEFKNRVNNLRNRTLAHALELDERTLSNEILLSNDLAYLTGLLTQFFSILTDIIVGEQLQFLPIEYVQAEEQNRQTDIELMLDKMALGSEILTLKEDDPERWKAHLRFLQTLSRDDEAKHLEKINRYRMKLFDRPPV